GGAARRGRGIEHFAKCGIRFEHDSLAPRPLLQQVRAGANRVLHDAVARVLVDGEHCAGGGAELTRGEPPLERVVRSVETYAQRVAVESLQTLDRRVVIEGARGAGPREHVVQANQVLFQQIEPIRANLGIDDPLDRIDVVVGGELARLAFERGVRGKVDAALALYRVGPALVGDYWQALGGVRDKTDGPREIIVRVKRFEDRPAHVERVRVIDGLRIEAVFGDRECNVERLGHVGSGRRRGETGEHQQGQDV